MTVTAILLAAWWTIGWALLRRWYGRSAENVLALPVGISVSVLTSLLLWMGGISIRDSAHLTWLAALVGLVYLLADRRGFVRPKLSLTGMKRALQRKRAAVMVILAAIVLFSAAILIAWQTLVQPVVWDNLTLYDFRAQRLAEGWLPGQFQSQFPGSSAYGMYDFLHPYFSSTLGAIVYASGGSSVLAVYAALLLTLLLHAKRVFRSGLSRLVFGVLFLATPLFFQAAVEGYAVWLAVLFWSHILLWLISRTMIGRSDLILISLLLTAAMQSRFSEPYWLVFLAWLGWRRAFSWILPLASFFPWQVLVKQAASQSATGVVRSPYAPAQFLPTVLARLRPSAIIPVLETLARANPLLPYAGIFLFTLAAGWGSLSSAERKWLTHWLVLAGLWSAMLVGGMLALSLWNPAAWSEVQLALQRAGLPLALLGVILTAWIVDRLPIDPDLVD